ncbi:MAG: hypothetical protein WA354_12955 [Terracidiphilus sp.]
MSTSVANAHWHLLRTPAAFSLGALKDQELYLYVSVPIDDVSPLASHFALCLISDPTIEQVIAPRNSGSETPARKPEKGALDERPNSDPVYDSTI